MENSQKLSLFYECGIYFFDDSNAVFMDPVRVLNRSYNRFRVSPSNYYSRFFKSPIPNPVPTVTSSPPKRKRKRKRKEPPPLNQREQIALQRHHEARPLLLEAQKRLVKSNELLDALNTFRSDSTGTVRECEGGQHSFVQLGRDVPFLEVTLNSHVCHPDPHHSPNDFEESPSVQCCEQTVHPAFNNLVANDTKHDAVAEILNNHYIIPRESCFYMLMLILVSISYWWIHLGKMLAPTKNQVYAALWVTHREKLRSFVERELFPAWGVNFAANFYWLKVKENGSLICDLDLFHHRPYECLILGYSPGKVSNTNDQLKFKPVKNDRVIMSIPGDYSRKPPIADLLLEYIPGLKPPRCLELFAREIRAGWVAWGNEPLYFQDSRYFVKVMDK